VITRECHFAIIDEGSVVMSEGTELRLTSLENIDHEAVMDITGSDGDSDYTMLLGPDLAVTGSTATAWLTSKSSPPAVRLEKGWTFLWGRKPHAQTSWVTASADGTTIVTQIASAALERVFYLKHTPWDAGERVLVTCGAATPMEKTVVLENEDDYVEWNPTCDAVMGTLNNPELADDIRDFIECVKMIAEAAGWHE